MFRSLVLRENQWELCACPTSTCCKSHQVPCYIFRYLNFFEITLSITDDDGAEISKPTKCFETFRIGHIWSPFCLISGGNFLNIQSHGDNRDCFSAVFAFLLPWICCFVPHCDPIFTLTFLSVWRDAIWFLLNCRICLLMIFRSINQKSRVSYVPWKTDT